MSWYRLEAQALAETFTRLGPQAPTLCQGWQARHLLAHLVLRDQRPWEIALDMLSGRTEPGTEPRLGALADEAADDQVFADLVQRFRRGPAAFSPLSWAGDATQLLEYVVHHEDLRRASTSEAASALAPRVIPPSMSAQIWRRLLPVARLRFARAPLGVVLVRAEGGRAVVRRSGLSVAVCADTVDLALLVFGRVAAAQLDLLGTEEATDTFTEYLGR